MDVVQYFPHPPRRGYGHGTDEVLWLCPSSLAFVLRTRLRRSKTAIDRFCPSEVLPA